MRVVFVPNDGKHSSWEKYVSSLTLNTKVCM